MTNFHDVTSPDELKSLLSQDLQRVSLLSFWAPMEGNPCEQTNKVVVALSEQHKNILVLSIQAVEQEEIADSFDVESVPTFIILRGHTLLEKIVGADAAKLTASISKHARQPTEALSKTDKAPAAPPATTDTTTLSPAKAEGEETPEELEARLRKLMNQSKVVAFIKGSPDAPRCGFSRKVVALLRDEKIDFTHFDILTDESVRQGLKALNDWPTFPQIIVNGELIGGLDVVQEMAESGELQEAITA